MRWTYIPGDPDAMPEPNGDDIAYMDRIVIDEMAGEDLGMSYLNDVAEWYAENNIRHGYQIRIAGHCFKGPYAIMWDRIEIAFEENGLMRNLRGHLNDVWGLEGHQNGEVGERRVGRIE